MHRVKKLVVYAHNTHCDHPFINRALKPMTKALAIERLVCSPEAGKWLYGKRFTVFNYAIDT